MRGKAPEEHEAAQEMKLINAAFEKYGKAVAKKEKQAPRVNKDASARMIGAALGPQRKQLS